MRKTTKEIISGRVIDTETTSFDGEVVEVGSVGVDYKGIMCEEAIEHLVCPTEHNISFSAMGVHGITPEMVEGMPKLGDIITPHMPTTGYIIAHNASFDLKVLPELAPDVKIICTLKLARKLFDKAEYGDHKNTTLWYGMGLYKKANYTGTPHRAGYDAQMTADILAFMLDDCNLTLDSAYEILNPPLVPVEESVCWMKKHKGIKWVDVVEDDPEYCNWLLSNYDWKDTEDHTKLKAFIKSELVKH